MAENNLNAFMIPKDNENDTQIDSNIIIDKKPKADLLVSLLFLIITGSGMCISGFAYALEIFNCKSFVYGLIILLILSITN